MKLSGQAKHKHAMCRHFDVVYRWQSAKILVLPKITRLYVACKSQLAEVNVRGQRLLVTVEDADGETAAGEWTRPHFNRTFGGDAIALLAQRVLIHRDDL